MSNNIKQETPLQYFHKLSSHARSKLKPEIFNGDVEFALVVKEAPISTFLSLRGNGADNAFCAAVAEVLGVLVPTEPGTYHSSKEASIYWLGPDEWMLFSSMDASSLEARLRASLSGHIAIVDISGGQTLINLRGDQQALEVVLKKSSVYDFGAWADASANAGRCVQSTFGKASAVVANKSDGSYDLIIRRSFADYLAQWLLHAGEEFGCRIEG
jgi:heterotetrameric sarcosine oxidase gamma subunit